MSGNVFSLQVDKRADALFFTFIDDTKLDECICQTSYRRRKTAEFFNQLYIIPFPGKRMLACGRGG